MNIFKRKNTELDPYKFDPTRSSFSLAVVLLITLALSYGYVLSKSKKTNAISLINELNYGTDSGLSKYVSAQPQDNYYLLLKDNTTVGFSYQKLFWEENYLVGAELTSLPDIMFMKKSNWKAANNLANWVEQSTTTSSSGVQTEIESYSQGIISIIRNRKIVQKAPLLQLSYNYIPSFLEDIVSSIGIRQYPKGLSFTIDVSNANFSNSYTIRQSKTDQIPSDVAALDSNSVAATVNYNNITSELLFDSNHRMIYQKNQGNTNMPFDTVVISDYNTIMEKWPEAKYLVPAPQTNSTATEI